MTEPLDYRPLLLAVTRDDVSRFRQQVRAAMPWSTAAAGAVFAAILAAVAIAILATFLPMVFASPAAGGTGATGFAFPLALLAVVGVAGAAVHRMLFGTRARSESMLRRTRFAAANGLLYTPTVRDPRYPGVIFSHGDSRHTLDSYSSSAGPELDVGNYRYSTGSGKNRTTHTWGYLALRLERRLPHMILDARGNNGLFGASNLPTSIRGDQKLSLEGDFDRYFTLYCPREYERDALYVFTPDLMALLIDESAGFDVEIVDDWMFVYSADALALDDAGTLERLFRIITLVGGKTLRQGDRYADERIGDPRIDLVAPAGRRLKPSYATAGITVVLVAAWIAFTIIR